MMLRALLGGCIFAVCCKGRGSGYEREKSSKAYTWKRGFEAGGQMKKSGGRKDDCAQVYMIFNTPHVTLHQAFVV